MDAQAQSGADSFSRRAAGRDRWRWVAWAGVAFLLVATFPGHYQPLRTGLDPSYQYALNHLADSDLIFGRDVNFPYGPLGYLLIPLDIGNNLIESIALRLLVHLLFAACVIHLVRLRAGTMPAIGFVLGYVLAAALGLPYEYHLLLVIGLLMGASLHALRWAWIPAAAGGLLAAVGLMAKFSLGLAALAILVGAEMVRVLGTEHDHDNRVALGTSAAYGIGVATLAYLHFGTAANLVAWLRTGWELTSGFSAAMSLPTRTAVLLLGLAALLAFLTALCLTFRREPEVLGMVILFLVPIWLSYRHGFVRQDVHIVNFFPFLAAVTAILLMNAGTRDGIRVLTAATLAITVLAVHAYSMAGILSFPGIGRGLAGVRGAENLIALVRLDRTREDLRAAGAANLEANRFPASWTGMISDSGESIDAFPWEITFAPANRLPWSPNPVLQTYTAYTAGLDRLSAGHFAGPGAPGFVAFEFKGIDMRHPLLAAPATVRELLRNYSLVDGRMDPDRLLLRRTDPRFPSALTDLETIEAAAGEWIRVPDSERLLFAGLELRPNWRGRIQQALFRVPPVSMEVEYAGGRKASFRILPSTAPNGLLLNYLPANIDEMAGLLMRSARDRVARFRVGGSGALLFHPRFEVTWRQAGVRIAYRPAGKPGREAPATLSADR